MVRLWIANTDNDWFDFLSVQTGLDEVNFWQPSGRTDFHAIEPGELFLFRLKSTRNMIGGFGVFEQPFHQLAFRADRMESLQQRSPQKLLRRNRRPAKTRIHRFELGV